MGYYDGARHETFTVDDGLPNEQIFALLTDRDGQVWLGGMGGNISRYEGARLRTFTPRDGLAHSLVKVVLEDHDKALWFGTIRSISRYDGVAWTTYTQGGPVDYAWGASSTGLAMSGLAPTAERVASTARSGPPSAPTSD